MKEKIKLNLYTGLLSLSFLYTLFVYSLPQSNDDSDFAEILAGKMIWQKKNCAACHQLYGLGGFLGPDLTNVYSVEQKGPGYITAFVRGGTTVMPAFPLSDPEMNSLLAFLRHVDASGKSDPKNFKPNLNGTIEKK